MKWDDIKKLGFMTLGILFAIVFRYLMRDFLIPQFIKFIIGFILLIIVIGVILLFKNKK